MPWRRKLQRGYPPPDSAPGNSTAARRRYRDAVACGMTGQNVGQRQILQ